MLLCIVRQHSLRKRFFIYSLTKLPIYPFSSSFTHLPTYPFTQCLHSALVWSCTMCQPSSVFFTISVKRPCGCFPSDMVSCHLPVTTAARRLNRSIFKS